MNKDYFLIKLIRRFRKLFIKRGVNFDHLITILSLKLTLDDRKNTLPDDKKEKFLTGHKLTLFTQAFLGIFTGILMTSSLDLFFKISINAGINMFFMMMYMISDFSSVLLDVRDKEIIMVKPVDSKTMNTARFIHVIYYMLSIFLALNLISIIVLTIKHGPLILACFSIMLIFMSLFIIFLTTIFYGFLLARFNGEKLKDILNIFQIILSIITVISYQMVGRIFNFIDLDMIIDIRWWSYFLPPAWYAAIFKVVVEKNLTSSYLTLAFLGIAVPLIVAMALIKYILPNYEGYLSKLQIEDGLYVPVQNIKSKIKAILYEVFAKESKERAFMKFADANMSRDRKLKLMLTPNQALAFIFPLIMLLPSIRGINSLKETLEGLRGSMVYLSSYMAAFMLAANFEYIQYSERHEASFIYDSYPLQSRKIIFKGAIKAYFLKYVIPGMIFNLIFFIWICGIEALIGLVIIVFSSFMMLIVRYIIGGMETPFSKEIGVSGNKNILPIFLMMGLAGIMAGLQYALVKNSAIRGAIALLCVIVLTQLLYFAAFKEKKLKIQSDHLQ